MHFTETVWEGVDWIHLAQDREVTGSYERSNEPWDSINGGEFLDELIGY
jgi:hypothetical protein